MTVRQLAGPRWVLGVLAAAATALLALAGSVLFAGPAQAAGTGRVFVIQGVLGATPDVVVDGRAVCPSCAPKSIVGPLSLAAGTHVVELRTGGSVTATARFSVTAGSSTDLVAHVLASAGSEPQLTEFTNDLTAVAPNRARLAVAHTAAAPPADIRVDGRVLFSNVANGEGLTVVVPAKAYQVDVVPSASAGEAILGPVSLPVKAGTLTRVFAVGSVADGSMDAVVHVLPIRQVGSGTPNRVVTGDGGQALPGGAGPLTTAGATALLAALALGVAWHRRWALIPARARARLLPSSSSSLSSSSRPARRPAARRAAR